jgi:hypothetical protein
MRRSAWWTAPTEPYSFHILSRSHNVVAAPSRGAAVLWFETPGVRIVAKSWLGDVEVCTVFLGLDHGFGMEPRWFETMIFGGPMAELCRRYRTWELAVEGHWDTLEELRMEALSTRVNPADDAYTH